MNILDKMFGKGTSERGIGKAITAVGAKAKAIREENIRKNAAIKRVKETIKGKDVTPLDVAAKKFIEKYSGVSIADAKEYIKAERSKQRTMEALGTLGEIGRNAKKTLTTDMPGFQQQTAKPPAKIATSFTMGRKQPPKKQPPRRTGGVSFEEFYR